MKKLLFIMAMMLPLFTFVGCSDDNEKDNVNTEPISIYVDDTYQVQMDITPTTVASENEFVAQIEMDGIVSGKHVGSTEVSIDGKYIIPVEVKGKIITYDDPVTKWGCDEDFIKSNQKQGKFSKSDDNLVYEKCGKADLVMYMMENGKLVSSGVVIGSQYASEMGEYLAERYFMIPYDLGDYTIGGFDAYETKDAKTFVAIKVYSTKYLMVIYMPYDKKDTKAGLFISDYNFINRMEDVVRSYLE